MDLILKFEQMLRFLEPASIAVLLAGMFRRRLLGLYRAFAAYLLIWFCQGSIALALGLSLGGDAYAYLFFASEPVVWILSYLVLIELFDLTFSDFPAIRSAGRLLLYGGIALSVVVATGTALPSLLELKGAGWLFRLYMVIERSVMILSLILLGSLQVTMARFGLRLPQNTVRYSRVFAIHFVSRAIQVFVFGEIDQKLAPLGNDVTMTINVACFVYLAFALTTEGVHARVNTGPALTEGQRSLLRERLQSVNDLVGQLRKRKKARPGW